MCLLKRKHLLTLLFCGSMVLGCRSKHAHHSKVRMWGKHTAPITLQDAPPGTVVFSWSQDGKGAFCSGSLIKPGVVMTAKHCVQRKLWGIPLPSASYMIFPGLETISLSAPSITQAPHPHADLALVFFDPSLLQVPQNHSELFSPPGGKHLAVYQKATFYGHGSLKHHLNYSIHAPSGDLYLRGSQTLSVLTPQKETYELLSQYYQNLKHQLDTPDSSQKVVQEESQLIQHYLKKYSSPTPNPILLATTNLSLDPRQATKFNEALFCTGDSGGGLRDREGKLMGVLSSIPKKFQPTINLAGSQWRISLMAYLFICRPSGIFVDLHGYRDWMEQQMTSHHKESL